MKCRAAERLISAERDGALSSGERAALEAHVAGCAACQHLRRGLADAVAAWRAADRAVPTPDNERAWSDIRREIRADTVRGGRSRPAWWLRMVWAGVPTAAAAALAVAVFTGRSRSTEAVTPASSWAQFVQVDAANAAPVITFDEASGWVVVWTDEAGGSHS